MTIERLIDCLEGWRLRDCRQSDPKIRRNCPTFSNNCSGPTLFPSGLSNQAFADRFGDYVSLHQKQRWFNAEPRLSGTAVVGRRVQYIDSLERGLGVSEYRPGDIGDRETYRLLLAIFAEAAKRKAS